jgi:putative RNA 2'-phosphotransferase
MKHSLVSNSKFLSLVLRHKPEEIGLYLDNNGWACIEELIDKAKVKGISMSQEELLEIVEQNDKKRFSVSSDGKRIRANQGHSIAIELNLEETIPPDILYHGTASRFLDSILKDGLVKGGRQHVHFSLSIDTAISVGQRHGKPVVLKIDSKKMHDNGAKFYRSENSVWLTDYVGPEYIEVIKGTPD